jgi:hypothetical protein
MDEESDPLMVKVQSRAPKTGWFGMDGVKKMMKMEYAEKGGKDKSSRPAPAKEPKSTGMPRTALNVPLLRALLLNQVG